MNSYIRRFENSANVAYNNSFCMLHNLPSQSSASFLFASTFYVRGHSGVA